MTELRRGTVVWAIFSPTKGWEQSGYRLALVVASDHYLRTADTLATNVPASTTDLRWPNHIRLRGPDLYPGTPTFALTEQPRTITRDWITGVVGTVDRETMAEVDVWLRDILSLH